MKNNILEKKSIWSAWLISLLLLGFFLLLPMATSLFSVEGQWLVQQMYKPLCHQLGDRCFRISGIPFAICHRCTGIYGGIVLSGLFYPLMVKYDPFLWRHAKWILLLGVIPLVLDWGLSVSGILENTWFSQLITGGLVGILSGYFVFRGFVQLILQFYNTKSEIVS